MTLKDNNTAYFLLPGITYLLQFHESLKIPYIFQSFIC